MNKKEARVFGPADILLPANSDMVKWSVVACDQHTSEPEYWERVDKFVGNSPSTFRLMLPEYLYHSQKLTELIAGTRKAMEDYFLKGIFKTLPESYIYIERTLSSGKVRRGLIGQLDLECYDHSDKNGSLIRATEGVVKEKIPPRIRLRDGAKAELTHVLVLVDDPERSLIEPLGDSIQSMEQLYEFDMMENGGHIRGFRVDEQSAAGIERAIEALQDPVSFSNRYSCENEPVLLFATGDGNHSLATAKACWDKLKVTLSDAERLDHPARFALVELINIWDEALEFEPIHRIVFDCDPQLLLEELIKFYPGSEIGSGEGYNFKFFHDGKSGELTVPKETSPLPIGALGAFLDRYLEKHPGKLDFVHGDDVLVKLAQGKNSIGFMLPAIDKSRFFASIIEGGAMPRKTFSMGSSWDKRYYLECRALEKG